MWTISMQLFKLYNSKYPYEYRLLIDINNVNKYDRNNANANHANVNYANDYLFRAYYYTVTYYYNHAINRAYFMLAYSYANGK